MAALKGRVPGSFQSHRVCSVSNPFKAGRISIKLTTTRREA
jgi:hypothetical protein